MSWRAYYADGRTVDSDGAAPGDLPPGVVCIVEYREPPYRELHAGGDFYVWDGEEWSVTGTGEWGEWLEEPEGEAVVRSCERQPTEKIEAVLDAAMEDRRWP